ncbi:hypothetical protein A500_13621, partial [Clostridium sartagoforme AAU1]
MNKLIKLQVNILSLFILSMLIFHCYVKLDRRKLSNKIFLDTSCVIFLIISIEIITVLINGSSHINIYINKLFSTLFNFSNSGIGYGQFLFLMELYNSDGIRQEDLSE